MSRRRPGNGSATLLDMLSNLFYFSLFLARERGVTGKEETKRERADMREKEKERRRRTSRDRRGEAHPPPSTLPATLRTRRRHFPISRQASAPALFPSTHTRPPSVPPFFLSLVSSRSFASFSRRKRKWKRGTKREKGKKEVRWWAMKRER